MKISIITPSFNQGDYLKYNLQSVSSQTYSNYEHLIYDAESTDSSIEQLKSYAASSKKVNLTIGKDGGQCQAINKGFSDSTGDIVCWLNSDDSYFNDSVLARVAKFFETHDTDIIYGLGSFYEPNGNRVKDVYVNRQVKTDADFMNSLGIFQPALFMRRRVFETVGGLDINYQLTLDYEYWIRIIQAGFKFQFVPEFFAKATLHNESKTCGSRTKQIVETLYLLKSRYGYVSNKWFERLFEHVALNNDWTTHGVKGGLEREGVTTSVDFRGVNTLTTEHTVEADTNSKKLKLNVDEAIINKVVVTSFSQSYLLQGLNLIASIHSNCFSDVDLIIVYSLDLTANSKLKINNLEGVVCVDYEQKEPWEGYYDPKSYMYKCFAINDAKRFLTASSGSVLWVDSGVCINSSLGTVWQIIEKDGAFLINHDDRSNKLNNNNFTHPIQSDYLKLNNEDLLADHVCSCVLGYKKGTAGEELVKLVFDYSKIKHINKLSKHPAYKWHVDSCIRPKNIYASDSLVSLQSNNSFFDSYYGHRQDQSLYSNVAAKLRLPIQSAKKWCPATDYSSKVSYENWKSGGEYKNIKRSDNIPLEINSVFFHHRGTVLNTTGLLMDRSFSIAHQTAFVLGNGPSLKELDFLNIDGIATIGMNAAYRYWDEKNWYPTYYCCMDLVVITSHAVEIHKLIKESAKNGIRAFFLRRCILEQYPELEKLGNVYFQEDLQEECPLFRVGPITTGSYSMLFLVYLGYRDIYLSGVDCNYVEEIKESTLNAQNELVIKDNIAKNPNYFFDSYQQKGDKYNIPNPNPGLHVRAWKNALNIINDNKHKVGCFNIYNTNKESKVDFFQNIGIDEIKSEICKKFKQLFHKMDRSFVSALQIIEPNLYEHLLEKFWNGISEHDQSPASLQKIELQTEKCNENEWVLDIGNILSIDNEDTAFLQLDIANTDLENGDKVSVQLLEMKAWRSHPVIHFTLDDNDVLKSSDFRWGYAFVMKPNSYRIYFKAVREKFGFFKGVKITIKSVTSQKIVCCLMTAIVKKVIENENENENKDIIVNQAQVASIADSKEKNPISEDSVNQQVKDTVHQFNKAIELLRKGDYEQALLIAEDAQNKHPRKYWKTLISYITNKTTPNLLLE